MEKNKTFRHKVKGEKGKKLEVNEKVFFFVVHLDIKKVSKYVCLDS